MLKEVRIGGQLVRLFANAGTPLRYRALFKKDLIQMVSDIIDEKATNADLINMAPELAFIMNAQADRTKEELSRLTMQDYFDWVDKFEDPMGFVNAAAEILSVYINNTESTAESKKEDDRLKES